MTSHAHVSSFMNKTCQVTKLSASMQIYFLLSRQDIPSAYEVCDFMVVHDTLYRYCQVVGVAGGLLRVWCGLMKLYHRTKSRMKSLILKIGFFFAGKFLKNRLVLAFMAREPAFNAVSLAESLVHPF